MNEDAVGEIVEASSRYLTHAGCLTRIRWNCVNQIALSHSSPNLTIPAHQSSQTGLSSRNIKAMQEGAAGDQSAAPHASAETSAAITPPSASDYRPRPV